ncbi:MAG TPA: phosphatase PAP2 family protein [Tepidisphaeraceae bacterium]|nr:phosphatase PAP2 family protein [Tepidisphaeraceae bacterium]
MRNRRIFFIIAIWLAAIIAAAALDRAVAEHVHAAGFDAFLHQHKLIRETLKSPGVYFFTIAAAILLAIFHPWRWRAAVMILLFTAVAGLNEPIKWIVGRARPFKSLSGEDAPLAPFNFHPFPPFGSKDLCFPSGHASLAFATAACLAIVMPRFRWLFYFGAMIVGLERIAENAHWLSDVVAAAALGIGGVWVLAQMFANKFMRETDG